MDIRPPIRVPKPKKAAEPPAADAPPETPAVPSLLRNEKRLTPLVFGAAAAVVLLLGVLWYAIGLPGAPAGVRRVFGRLPEAGPRFGPVPTPGGPPSLITGLPCGEAYKRRPIAVMLGSDPVARPLSGMAGADLMLEVPVLVNNVTRQMAVYQCGQPKEIGGVRSARHDYLFLAKGLDAVIAHWGGSYHALNRIRFERAQNGGPVSESIDALRSIRGVAYPYYRITRLPGPYNGYTTYDRLWEAVKQLGYRTYSVFEGYPHEPDAPPGQRGAGTLDISWPGAMRVRYVYNPETNAYERFWGGTRHLDGLDNQPVNPKVLVVMHAEQRFAQGAGGYNDVDVEGSGPVEVYQNGQVISGTWSKSDVHKQDPLVFRSALGRPIAFVPGQIWIHVVDGKTDVVWTPGGTPPPDPEAGQTPRDLGG